MLEEFSEGRIHVIPNTSDISSDIRQWHPMTLLNTVYKTMAKTLSNQLEPFISDIIHESHTRFMNGRRITYSLFGRCKL